jgi:hypothetical protein
MTAASELSAEEQKLFDEMKAEVDPAPKVEEKAEAKSEEKAAPKAEEKPEAKAEEKPEKKDAVVPKAALDEARSQNKELRKELDALKKMVADGDGKLQRIVDSISKKADEPAPPRFEDDPAGALKHENEQLKKALADINAKLENQEQAREHSGKVNAHATAVASKEAAFAKEHADYYKAADYVAQVWREEFLEAGFDEAEVPKLVFGKSLGITTKATQAGKDPASVIYNLAKRAGFAATQKEASKKEEGESKLKTIEKGMEAAKGNGGGSGPDEDGGLTGLANLDDAELEKRVQDKDWWAKNIRRTPLH